MTADMPTCEFAFPRPLRDKLVAAVLDGTETSTTSLILGLSEIQKFATRFTKPKVSTSLKAIKVDPV